MVAPDRHRQSLSAILGVFGGQAFHLLVYCWVAKVSWRRTRGRDTTTAGTFPLRLNLYTYLRCFFNTTAATAVVFVVAVLVVTLAIADLVRVVDEDGAAAPSWKTRMVSCRDRILRAVPLTAIKIVLVSWQIVTQARRARVYFFLARSDHIRRNACIALHFEPCPMMFGARKSARVVRRSTSIYPRRSRDILLPPSSSGARLCATSVT